MAITILDVNSLRTALTNMWQKELNTSEDPPNGKWYTNGANNDNIGLYGGLTDAVVAGIQVDQTKLTYLAKQLTVMSTNVDNRNGLNSNANQVTLSNTYTDSTTVTHTFTNAIQIGATFTVSGKVDVEVAEIGGSASFSINYTFTYASATSTTNSSAITFSEQVPVTVPSGKLYQVVLTASSQQIQVPFTATVTVSGTTETWFEDRINGHYNWSMGVAQAFTNINADGSAGSDSANYTVDSSNSANGAVVVNGMLNYQTVGNYAATVYDITPATVGAAAAATGGAMPAPAHSKRLVGTIKMKQPGSK